jgi:hypothetical protein
VFPHPGVLELVLAEGFEGHHHQAGVAVGAQAQVGLEELAGRGLGRQPGVGALAEAGVELGGFGGVVVVDEDHVEVGGVAELLAAELAVGEHRKLRVVPVAVLDLAPAHGDGEVDDDVGQRRQEVGVALDGELAGDVLGEQAEDLGVVLLAHQVHLAFHVGLDLVELRASSARKAGRSSSSSSMRGSRASSRRIGWRLRNWAAQARRPPARPPCARSAGTAAAAPGRSRAG